MNTLKKILSVVTNKYFLIAVVLVVAGLGSFKLISYFKSDYENRLATYQRQIAGQLSDQEHQLQAANNELGIAKSELVTQKELAKRLKTEKDALDAKFQAFIKEHDLIVTSKDETIAKLRQQINGGNSGTTIIGCDALTEQIKQCTITYSWSDALGRFTLKDPNIFVQNNEIFTSEQYFKIHGEIYKQKDGSLQTHRLTMNEVRKVGDKYEVIEGGKAEIIDSSFVYTDPSFDKPFAWRDLFRLRGIAVANVNAYPLNKLGNTNLGLGLEFFQFRGLGVGTFTNLDFNKISNWGQSISVQYNPTIFGKELNLGIGANVGTPFSNMFHNYTAGLDILFYINN